MTDTPEDVERVARVAQAIIEAQEPHRDFRLNPHYEEQLAATRPIARAAIAAMPTPWRPIETLERDCETEVDLWCEGLEGDGWLLRGVPYIGEPMWIKTWEGTDYFPHENGGWVTHWCPVPAPPADRQPLPSPPSQSIEP